MNKKEIPQIAIIGGGAAGMMAAATLLESEQEMQVHLFEKNKNLGAKVIISGGGRCNVTTGLQNKQQLLKKYSRGAEFLKAALSKFPPQQVYDWFEAHGVPLKIENDNRVFPQSNDGHDVVKIFEDLFESNNADLHLLAGVTEVLKQDDGFLVKTNNEEYVVDAVILTTGGNAYRHTGSTGDGYAFATALGHSITELGPSLNSFMIKEDWPKALSGISLENARLKFNKVAVDGPLLFTHFGISGPVTFSLSSQIAFEHISEKTPLEIQLIPDATKTFEDWEQDLLNASTKEGKKQLNTYMQTMFPKRLVDSLLALAQVQRDLPLIELSKQERKSLSKVLSGGITLTLQQRRPGDEFVTAGGVSTDEINPQTMESLVTPNLYFAGELMDVDGVTGGFNLQASWAAGRLAGKSVLKK
jgi:predicted Rossmann fold flavoprotein